MFKGFHLGASRDVFQQIYNIRDNLKSNEEIERIKKEREEKIQESKNAIKIKEEDERKGSD